MSRRPLVLLGLALGLALLTGGALAASGPHATTRDDPGLHP